MHDLGVLGVNEALDSRVISEDFVTDTSCDFKDLAKSNAMYTCIMYFSRVIL